MEKYFPVKKAITEITGDNYIKATKNSNAYHLFLSPVIFKDFLTEEKANNLYTLKGESSGDSSIDLSPYAKKSELEPYLTEEEADNKYKLKSDNPDLSPYLKEEVAQSTYAKKTDLDPFLTEEEANSLYALKGESSESDPIDLSDYAKKSDLSLYIEESRADNKYALKTDIDNSLTLEDVQDTLADYELTSAVDNKISNLKNEIQENYYKKDDDLNVDLTDYLTKTQADTTYQKKSDMGEFAKKTDITDFVTKSEIPEGGVDREEVRQIVNEIIDPLKASVEKVEERAEYNKNDIENLRVKTWNIDDIEDDVDTLTTKISTLEDNVKKLQSNQGIILSSLLDLQEAVKKIIGG